MQRPVGLRGSHQSASDLACPGLQESCPTGAFGVEIAKSIWLTSIICRHRCCSFLFQKKSVGLDCIACFFMSKLCLGLMISKLQENPGQLKEWYSSGEPLDLDFIRLTLRASSRLPVGTRTGSRSQWALPDLNCELQISVGTAGPQLRAPDLSGHCQTSTASSRSQWALPDLNCEVQISVGTAGPQLRAPDLSGHCRTSTASSRSQWALPDLNCELQISVGTARPQLRAPDLSGHCRTSTASSRSQWALPDLNCELQVSVGTERM